MGAFEYLSVLISIILALGITRVLAGVGEMLQARGHRRIYWVHVVWIVNLFIYRDQFPAFPDSCLNSIGATGRAHTPCPPSSGHERRAEDCPP
jgi:hypothetical protein